MYLKCDSAQKAGPISDPAAKKLGRQLKIGQAAKKLGRQLKNWAGQKAARPGEQQPYNGKKQNQSTLSFR
jgi:hypothetical protein